MGQTSPPNLGLTLASCWLPPWRRACSELQQQAALISCLVSPRHSFVCFLNQRFSICVYMKYIHIHKCIYIHSIYIYRYICIYIYLPYVYTYVHTCISTCIYVAIDVCTCRVDVLRSQTTKQIVLGVLGAQNQNGHRTAQLRDPVEDPSRSSQFWSSRIQWCRFWNPKVDLLIWISMSLSLSLSIWNLRL